MIFIFRKTCICNTNTNSCGHWLCRYAGSFKRSPYSRYPWSPIIFLILRSIISDIIFKENIILFNQNCANFAYFYILYWIHNCPIKQVFEIFKEKKFSKTWEKYISKPNAFAKLTLLPQHEQEIQIAMFKLVDPLSESHEREEWSLDICILIYCYLSQKNYPKYTF